MEANMRDRADAYGCLELVKEHIRNKKLHCALKLSIQAYKLCPSPPTKLIKLKSRLKKSKIQPMTRRPPSPEKCFEESSVGEDSDSSFIDDCNTEQPTEEGISDNESSLIDMKKDGAFKCLQRAEQCIAMNQFRLAEQFVHKSNTIYPSSVSDDFLKTLKVIRENRKPKFTEEQANIVKKVINCENYYKMFGIKYTATKAEIRLAYKILASLVHPDKNSAPGSEDAFKIIWVAVDTLCDDIKRSTYDLSLNEPLFCPSTSKDVSNMRGKSTNIEAQFWSSFEVFCDSDGDEYVSESEDDVYEVEDDD